MQVLSKTREPGDDMTWKWVIRVGGLVSDEIFLRESVIVVNEQPPGKSRKEGVAS